MKQNSLETNLKKYSLLAGSVTAAISTVNAQIVYTDVNPDTLLNNHRETYALDLDNNGVVEFNLQSLDTAIVDSSYNMQTNIQIVGAAIISDVYGASFVENASYPLALAQGDTIDGNDQFDSYPVSSSSFGAPILGILSYSTIDTLTGNTIAQGTQNIGNFIPNQEAFVGIRFDISGNVHYGWLRVEMSSDADTIIIKDYAYESSANTAIIAGNTGGGMLSIAQTDNNITINKIQNLLYIKLDDYKNNSLLNIYDISGREVLESKLSSNNEQISLNDFEVGVYLVRVVSGDDVFSKKIYLSNR